MEDKVRYIFEEETENQAPTKWWGHDWQKVDMYKTFGPQCLMMEDIRVCSKCGQVQHFTQDTSWMRNVGKRYWSPSTREIGKKCPKGMKDDE